MRRTFIVAFAVVLVVGVGIVAGGAVADPGNETEGNESTDLEEVSEPDAGVDQDGNEYTLEELRTGGTLPSGSPPSVRMSGDQMWWVVHWPADSFGADVGDPMDNNWRYLERDQVVERNSVWLRTIKSDSDAEELTVNVAYYDIGERERQVGEDETVTEQYPEDLIVDQQQVAVDRGWAMEEISLRQSEDERYATMWVEGEDELRWTFKHDSIATTESAGIDSEGDYLYRAAMEFLLPIFLGTFIVGGGCKRLLEKSRVGPQWGYLKWMILLTIGTGMFVMSQFSTMADLMTMAPYVAAAFLVGVVAIVILESYSTNVHQAEFIKPELGDAVSPSGEEALDMIRATSTEEKIIKLDDGRTAVVRPGIRPFLSRCFGGAAILQGAEKIKTTVDVVDSRIDEKYFVHPDSEQVLDYEPEGWTLEVPEIEDRDELLRYGAAGLVAILIGMSIGSALSPGWGAGVVAIAAIIMMARPTMGHAKIDPAPAHLTSAWASTMYLKKEHEEADTLEDLRDRTIELEARNQSDVEEALEQQDSTLIESMFDSDVDRSIKTSNEVEEESPKRDGIEIEVDDD